MQQRPTLAAGSNRAVSDLRTDGRIDRVFVGSSALTGLVVGVVMGLASCIVVTLLCLGLDYFGVIESINDPLMDMLNVSITTGMILIALVVIFVANILFYPLMFIISSIVYNLAAAITGGLKIKYDLLER